MCSLRTIALCLVLAAGCGAAAPRVATAPPQRRVVNMEAMRISAHRSRAGGWAFRSYDAETLFRRATELVNAGHCPDGVRLYERIADDFHGSAWESPGLYNAGLCLQDNGERAEAVRPYERLVRELPNAPDVRDATFQLAHLYVQLERWDDAIAAAGRLLVREDLEPDQRMEAMARRAQGLLGAGRLDDAAEQARSALTFSRTRPESAPVRDDYFTAAANYVLAETFRLKAEAMAIPPGVVSEQRAALEARARLILDAQREYFNTIEATNASWAAAAGYRIGEMYDSFWQAIMSAPVPPPRTAMNDADISLYRHDYRISLARLIKPLIRHSIRYWELTLMMIERTGVQTEWKDRIDAALESGAPASARAARGRDRARSGPRRWPCGGLPPCAGRRDGDRVGERWGRRPRERARRIPGDRERAGWGIRGRGRSSRGEHAGGARRHYGERDGQPTRGRRCRPRHASPRARAPSPTMTSGQMRWRRGVPLDEGAR